MNRKKKRTRKIVLTTVIGIAAVFLYLFLLNMGQNRTVTRQFRTEMSVDTALLKERIDEAALAHDSIRLSFDRIHEENAAFFSHRVLRFLEENFSGPDGELPRDLSSGKNSLNADLEDFLLELNIDCFNCMDVMIADSEGRVVASSQRRYPDLKAERYAPLRTTFTDWYPVSLTVLSEEEAWLNYAAADPDEAALADLLYSEDVSRFCSFHAVPLYGDYQLVTEVFALDEVLLAAASDTWTVLLQNEIVGEQGYAFAWSAATNRILFYPDSALKYHDVSELGLDLSVIRDGEAAWNTIQGRKMYLLPVFDETRDVWIACAVSAGEMISSRRPIAVLQGVVFALLAAALVWYVNLLLRQDSIQVLTDFTGSGKKYAYQSMQYKLFAVTVLISTLMLLFSVYVQTLFLMSSWADSSASQTERIQSTVAVHDRQARSFVDLYLEQKDAQFIALAKYLTGHEDAWTPDELDECAGIFGASNLQILGKDGKSRAGTSYVTFSPAMPESGTAVDYRWLESSQDQERGICDWMADGRHVIETMTSSDGKIIGYLYLWYYSAEADEALLSWSLPGTLDMARPGRSGFVFSVDRHDHIFTYYPQEDMIGENAMNYGLTESQIRGGCWDYIRIENIPYYAVTSRIGDNVIFYAVARTELFHSRILLSVTAVILAFVLFLLIGVTIYTSREQIELLSPDDEKRDEQRNHPTAEFRLMRLLRDYVALAALLVTVYTGVRSSFFDSTMIDYVLDGNWERGFNVFALTDGIIILCRGGLVVFIVSWMAGKIRNIYSARAGTILKMLTSLFTYFVYAFLLYRCMVCFGLNPTALMASTGIIAVVLGIGANSMVGDILAGIFLLMEGMIQVGDVVQVGGFRGYVMELGIRMTQIYDMDSEDVKIIPNNEVRNVVHMSMRRANVFSEFQIRYEEDLEDVERILRKELAELEDRSPFILEGPFYIGVSALGDNGVCLKTVTRCHEANRRRVEREVNHIVYSIFRRHHIEVPYPQVTVHTGGDEPAPTDLPGDRDGG